MRTLIVLLALMSVNAIARVDRVTTFSIPKQRRDVHPYFNPMVEKFEREFGATISFPVVFFNAEPDDKSVGKCSYWPGGEKLVQVDIIRWFQLNKTQQELVIYHELGHCQLNQPHDDGLVEFKNVKGKWPKTIMRPTLFDPIEALVYKTNRNYYILELKYATRRLSNK